MKKDILLENDLPLKELEEDEFGYRQYAENIASLIFHSTPKDGMVYGIFGGWGTGKTTFLNFVKKHIDNFCSVENTKKPIIIDFNPWWFSGQEDIIRRFFYRITSVLRKENDINVKLCSLLSALGDCVAEVPIPGVSIIGKALHLPDKMMKGLNPHRNDPFFIREEIVKTLKNEEKKIIVFIDDIDRMNSEEIKHLFSVIKSIADFPNITYVLSFDKNVILNSLSDDNSKSEKYLEKIIQIPYNLPYIDVADFFLSRFKSILIENKFNLRSKIKLDRNDEINFFDDENWDQLFEIGVLPFLSTPRKVLRLINCIKSFYTSASDKNIIQPVKLLATQTLMLNCPDIYIKMQQNRKYLSRLLSSPIKNIPEYDDEIRSFFKGLFDDISKCQKHTAATVLINYIFPNLYGYTFKKNDEPENNSQSNLSKNTFLFFEVYFPQIERVYNKNEQLKKKAEALEIELLSGNLEMDKLSNQDCDIVYTNTLYNSTKRYSSSNYLGKFY